MVADRTEVRSRPSRTAGNREGGPSGQQTGPGHSDTEGSYLASSGGRGGWGIWPEEVGAQTGLQALQQEMGL